ncbi:hypothetical protein FO519_000228 [Halicephalobus sp. NKZ332]|nr:hypothetical protein FO519_000228 [Halicephalobus sp. NKZ332]
MAASTAAPILPKPQPVPVIFIPVSFAPSIRGPFFQNPPIDQTPSTVVPPAPLPPPTLLLPKRRRVPILIDQKSLKKNLQSNKQYAGIDPLVQVRGQLLKRNKLADNLNSKLRKRPGPLELVTRKILQVDAELEQAIQEGRLPFTPVESRDPQNTVGMISTQLAPNRFEDVNQQIPLTQNPTLVSNGPKAKIRKKSQQLHRASTPYDNNCSNGGKIIKLKTLPGNKRFSEGPSTNIHESLNNGLSIMETDSDHMPQTRSENNYEITLKQQQIFLQWHEDHHKNPETNALTPAMSSSTSTCSTPLQSVDGNGIRSTRSSFSMSSGNSNHPVNHLSSGCSRSASPASGDAFISVPMETEKPKSKLADFKVQDLKNECKKRQLPVSGAKTQLLERLRPYEDAILANLASEEAIESPNFVTFQQNCHRHVSNCQSMPAQDVIHDYLQQCQPNIPQKSLVLQIPPNGKVVQVLNKSSVAQPENPLLFKLVDANGSVVGVATVPQAVQTKSTVPCNCPQCNGTQLVTTSGEQFIFSEPKICEPTFSFSQMGSGECRTMVSNCAGCIAAASQNVHQNPEPVQIKKQKSQTPQVRTCSPLVNKSQSIMVTVPPNCPPMGTTSTVDQTVASVAHRRHSTPSVHITQQSENVETLMSPSEEDGPQNLNPIQDPNLDMDDSDVSLDEIDPNNLVTAKTFAQHEENLRQQQRLIEELQRELAKSQDQLRREQKLIIKAKKLQLQTDKKTGKQCSQAEILLNNLDVKNVNKIHIQHFLQHKSQQQILQTRTGNYQQLHQVEQKLQEELHIEQAVQDIVRLIKQDGRTALLIVQLLRRYQLERNHQVQQAREQQVQNQTENESIQNESQKPAQIVVIDDTPVSSPFIEKNTVETSNEAPKKNSKNNKRKSSGSRSIWSRSDAFEKQPPAKTGEKSSVDMEEIFRSVIDATRDTHEPNPGNHEESIGNDASSDLVPQLNGFHLVTSEDFAQPEDKITYTRPEEICTTAVFVHEENNSSCHVDCYSKPANGNSPERIQFSKQHQEFAATQQYDFSKNEDFEDLMDVLRDDQQGVSNSNSNNGKEILGYTSVELANFLAAECESDVHSNNGIFDLRDLRGMEGRYVHIGNYQQHPNFDQHQNFDVEPPSMENDTLSIEPHQEQAIDDVLNGEMQEPNVEWFDNLFQSPMPDRQNGNFGNGTSNVNVQRPMDAFV